MNIINNSRTKHFCPDCRNMSLNGCKCGHGDYSFPCYIMRKLANKQKRCYELEFRNESACMSDFKIALESITDTVKYFNEFKDLDLDKKVVRLAIIYNVYTSYEGRDFELEEINEFSLCIELNPWMKSKCLRLAKQINYFETKIHNEWFAIPENKKAYLSYIKGETETLEL